MKRIILSILSVVLAVGMVGGGAFAYFRDTETSSDNTFTAGILDMAVDCDGDTEFLATDDPLPLIFDYLPVGKPIAPGDSGEATLSLHLKEATTINADLWMQVTNLVNIDAPNPEPEVSETIKDLTISDEILTKVWLDDGDNILETGELVIVDGTLDTLIARGQFAVAYNVQGGQTKYVGWSWELPTTVGNESQGDTCTFDIIFGADQVTTYTLTTSGDGNGSVIPSGGTYAPGTSVTLTPNPNPGYEFDHWSGDYSGTANPGSVTMDGPKTVQANFAVGQYTITFDTAGGSPVGSITLDYGSAVAPPADPTKTGYNFSGWNPPVPSIMPLNGATLTAQWTANQYTITFDPNGGGTPVPTTKQVTYGSTYGALATVTRTGYTFNGWFTASTGGTQVTSGTTVAITSAQTLYAQWTANLYTITFDSAGGTTVSAITQAYGSSVTAPANPTRSGYTFAGWSPAVPATMPLNGAALTAQWTANSYVLTYSANPSANGSISGTTPQTVNPGGSGTPVMALPNTGYAFMNWSDGVLTPWRTDTNVTANVNVTANFILNDAFTMSNASSLNWSSIVMPSRGGQPLYGDIVSFDGGTQTLVVDVPNAMAGTVNVRPTNSNKVSTLKLNSSSQLTVNNIVIGDTSGSGKAGSIDMTSGGSLIITGAVTVNRSGTWTRGTGTVVYGGAGAQNINTSFFTSYNNLVLSGSGAKTLPSPTAIAGNLSIAPTGTATASLSGNSNTANTLTLGGIPYPGTNQTWGSTASSATNKNDTYFTSTATGRVTVAN
jgi:predicted ribosomally synthesized peptide with SipW-like signal peptide/uncharacterized repeat protein (TIGR02543 family)